MAKTSPKISIGAPKLHVFNPLTTKDGRKGRYTPDIKSDVTEGETAVGKFTERDPFRWKFVEAISPTSVRWRCVEGPGAAAGMEVIFHLSDHARGRTTVDCYNDGFTDSDGALKFCNTLWRILMGRLQTFSETAKAPPTLN
jgi:hypothetical protein